MKRVSGVSLFLCCAAALLVFSASAVSAQDEAGVLDASQVPAESDAVENFIPEGWKIEESIEGELNGDKYPDAVIKLVEDKPATGKDDTKIDRGRALLIILGNGNQKLRLGAVATSLLQCTGCGGAFYGVSDAPANIKIEKGVIIVEQDHGSRWLTDTTYRFRYDEQPDKFILIGFDYNSSDRGMGSGASESTNYLTGKRISTTSKGKRDVSKTTVVAKSRFSIEEVDSSKFEEDAMKRLGLD